ncbi:MAG: hypothetical protein NVS4B7_01010 [Ktedonobacteraceae bacterium]
MNAVCLHAKDEIEKMLRQNTFLHLYELGDLDDFFWPYTTWYALQEIGESEELALLYTGMAVPVLLGITEHPHEMRKLLQFIIHLLPKRFYAHLSGDAATALKENYVVQSYGLHYKMALRDSTPLAIVDTSYVMHLSVSHIDEIEALYRASYPGNSFDPRMLETGYYYGIRRDNRLVSVAGIHVYSRQYKIAVLGNVTTHPDWRGQGLGTVVCAKLCQALLPTVDALGLNVKADNTSAIACYKRLGFECIAEYEEYACELK